MARLLKLPQWALIALILATLLWPSALQAQEGLQLEAQVAFAGNYTPGTWLPVHVSLRNDGPPRTVLVAATTPGASVRNVQPVELPAGAAKEITLYVALDQETRLLRLSVEQAGVVLVVQEFELRPRSGERMLGLLVGQDPQLRLPRRQDLAEQPFNSFLLELERFPERAAGLSSLGMLLLHDLPSETLRPDQHAAILAWVHAGGHLILAGGLAAPRTLAGLPPALLPASFGAAQMITDLPLAALAEAAGPGPLNGIQLLPVPGARVVGPADAPAWVSNVVGRGQVTQLAFDPAQPALANWAAAPSFWDQLLRPAVLVRSSVGLQTSVDALQEQIITASLASLPAIQLPPTDLIFLILAIYAVLIGPGVALLLRRADRQTWAWLVVPLGGLAVAGLTLAIASTLRPDQRLVTRATLVEQIAPDQARTRAFVSGFAPQAQRLPLTLSDTALTRSLRVTGGNFSAVEGVSGDLNQFSATGELDLAAWRVQGLLADQLTALAGFQASITVVDATLQLELVNAGDQPLRDAVAVFGEQVIALGSLAPGEQRRARWPSGFAAAAPTGAAISTLVLRDELADGRRPGQAPPRELLVREALINAAVVRSDTLTDEGPLVLAWLERSPLELQVQGPAAQQATTLLVLRPSISGSGPLSLPRGWLRPDWASLENSRCFSGQGSGIAARPTPVSVALRLPAGLATMRADEVTLLFESERRWPNAGVTTEIYDWAAERWVEFTFEGPGELRLAPATPYLRNGELRVRLDGQIGAAECLYVSAQLQGALP